MNKKQIKKLVQKIVDLELVHQDPASSKEAKAQAENDILQISGMLSCLPNGLEIMDEIDLAVQKVLNNNNNKGDN